MHCCMRLNAQRELHRPASWFTPSSNVATLMQLKPLTMYWSGLGPKIYTWRGFTTTFPPISGCFKLTWTQSLVIVIIGSQSCTNCSDCGVLVIAYAFDVCSGLNPCSVRFDHSKIRPHLITCLENCQVSRFPVLGDRESVQRKTKTVELHCSCRMPEKKDDKFAECDSCHVWYHHHYMDIPCEVFGDSEVHWECNRCVKQRGTWEGCSTRVCLHLNDW